MRHGTFDSKERSPYGRKCLSIVAFALLTIDCVLSSSPIDSGRFTATQAASGSSDDDAHVGAQNLRQKKWPYLFESPLSRLQSKGWHRRLMGLPFSRNEEKNAIGSSAQDQSSETEEDEDVAVTEQNRHEVCRAAHNGNQGRSRVRSFLRRKGRGKRNRRSSLLDETSQFKWAEFTLSGIQLGLAFYLGQAIFKGICELVEECIEAASSVTGSGASALMGGEAPVIKRDDLARALAFFNQDPAGVARQLEQAASGSGLKTDSAEELPSLQLLQLAHKLSKAGLPLNADSVPDGKPSVESVLSTLTRAEAAVLHQCLWVPPTVTDDTESLQSMWVNIAGLHHVKTGLLASLHALSGRYSTTHSDAGAFASLFQDGNGAPGASGSSSLTPGILLFGPPGCGKTLLVRALAMTARLPCLVVTPSVLLRKFVGETNEKVRSLFSLAYKLAPCIVCIDELDGLFRERSLDEHEVSRDLKTEFLQWWDGGGMLAASGGDSSVNKNILFIGATNRPFEVDAAVLRRLPRSYFVGQPNANDRLELLTQLLDKVPTACCADHARDPNGVNHGIDLRFVAERTVGYSPSDLKQVVQTAALMGPLREQQQQGAPLRALTTHDLMHALQQTFPTPLSQKYRQSLQEFAQRAGAFSQAATSPSPADPAATSTTPAAIQTPSGGMKWETEWGNFYHAGTLQVDAPTFDVLMAMMELLQDEDAQPPWSGNADDDDDDDDAL